MFQVRYGETTHRIPESEMKDYLSRHNSKDIEVTLWQRISDTAWRNIGVSPIGTLEMQKLGKFHERV